MKKLLWALGLLYLAASPDFVLSQERRCGSTEYMNRLISEDPNLAKRLIQNEEVIQKAIEQQASNRSTSVIYTIPVVFHVLYQFAGQNVPNIRLADQVAVLNADFARLNADTGNTPLGFRPQAAASNIRFCMAQRDPNGNWTNGVIRKVVSVNGFDPLSNDNVKFTALGGSDAWSTSDYLNIWVCNFTGASSTLLGISQMPGMGASTDGCVVLNSTVGGPTYPGTLPDFNHGRTLTHEVGHWFALYHTWGDDGGACSGTDYVNDTPNQSDENYGCPNYPVVDGCSPNSPGVMFMSYMDYVNDDCMNMFSAGQVSRLHNALGALRPSLMSSVGCNAPVGIAEPMTIPDFAVYPNPSAGRAEITASLQTPVDATLRVHNSLGQLVYSEEIRNTATFSLTIDLSRQTPGVYTVTLQAGDMLESRRLVLTGE